MLGIDTLGGVQYQSETVAAFRKLPQDYAVGVFWKEFGNAANFLDALYSAGCRTFRVHIVWDGSHTYGKSKQDETIAEYKNFVNVMKVKRRAQWYVSLFCEHNIHDAILLQSLVDQARKISNIPTFVNAPWTGAKFRDGIAEVHGVAPKKPVGPYFVSPDGKTLDKSNAATYNAMYADAQIRFAWNPKLNLHKDGNDKTRSVKPTASEIVALAQLLTVTK